MERFMGVPVHVRRAILFYSMRTAVSIADSLQSPARARAVRLKETHGQASLRLGKREMEISRTSEWQMNKLRIKALRAWDVISLTDKKSVFRHLHGQ
jgi:hypothetical protein